MKMSWRDCTLLWKTAKNIVTQEDANENVIECNENERQAMAWRRERRKCLGWTVLGRKGNHIAFMPNREPLLTEHFLLFQQIFQTLYLLTNFLPGSAISILYFLTEFKWTHLVHFQCSLPFRLIAFWNRWIVFFFFVFTHFFYWC